MAETFRWRTSDAVDGVLVVDEGANVVGVPVCCEVCARTGTADDACGSACVDTLCDQAEDQHRAIGWKLSEGTPVCAGLKCGFDYSACQSGLLFPQVVDFVGTEQDVNYALQVECEASSLNAPGPSGLFEYVGELSEVPGAGPALNDVQDVAAWCLDLATPPGGTGGGDAEVGGDIGGGVDDEADGADSSGGGVADDTGGEPPPAVQGVPDPCGPFAQQRYWVRPSNNYATWTTKSTGVGVDGGTSYPMAIRSGGLEYTVLPCPTGSCVRLDRVSASLTSAADEVTVDLNLREPSELLAIDAAGSFVVPANALKFAARYVYAGAGTLIDATNERLVLGTIDKAGGSVRLAEFTATSSSGAQTVALALDGDLVNTQPEPSIDIVSTNGGAVSLRASTVDSEGDPVSHSWMIPGVGSWEGDALDVTLPAGRHAVVLYAEDVHRSRSLDAVWVEVASQGS